MNEHRTSIVGVVRKYFPGWELSFWDEVLLKPEWFLSQDEYWVADHEEQLRHLESIEEGVRAVWDAYNSLHPAIRRRLDGSFGDNRRATETVIDLKPFSTTPEAEPIHVSDPLGLFLRLLLSHLNGYDPDGPLPPEQPNRVGAKALHDAAELKLKSPSAQEKHHETWQKAVLVARARQLWQRNIGEPPRIPSAGRNDNFFSFVEELIEAAGKSWKTESTFKAWSDRANKSGKLRPEIPG